ncbi:MAG: nitroreductase family protein [Peptococcaceae bacterium]|jgi:nitroreductase|nr:nitroreductase family protein [Peptococcaceae bacterium]MDH7525085.1 nitroreductase family protein [Peptococcaceae bacterium]
MEFRELVTQRRSIRRFKPDPVSMEDIKEIIAAAVEAPNAGNEQMWHFMIITNEKKKEQMAEIITNRLERLAAAVGLTAEQVKPVIKTATFFSQAPVVIAVTTRPYRSKVDQMLKESGLSDREIDELRSRPDLQSIGAVIQNLLLAAWEKGYGSCWMTGPCVARPELEAFLGVTGPRSLAALVPIGRAEIVPATRGRKPIEEVITIVE